MADPYGKTNLQPGFRLFDGSALNTLFSRIFQGGLSRKDTITATAGGTKAAAIQLDKSLNHITVCATNGDSALLPKAIAGSIVVVRNDGAANASLYGKGTDTIDGAATANATALNAGVSKMFVCFTTGAWFTLSAS